MDITLSTWTHPTTGQQRRYLDPQQVWDIMPAEDPHGFTYKGADMDRILSAKYWLDANDTLHIERLTERGRVTEADVRTAIETALAPAAEAEAPEDDEPRFTITDTAGTSGTYTGTGTECAATLRDWFAGAEEMDEVAAESRDSLAASLDGKGYDYLGRFHWDGIDLDAADYLAVKVELADEDD